EVTRLEDLPRIVRRAAKVAMTPPTGPVFLSLPGDILNAEAGIDLAASTRVDTRSRPSDQVLEALAKRLLKSERPVIVVGDETVKSDALEAAAKFAQTLGAPVYQQSVAYGAHFISEHPCYMGSLSRDQKQVRGLLSKYDLLIALGTDPVRMSVWSEVEPLPDNMPIVQIGLLDWDMGKNYPAEMAVRADLGETLVVLAPLLAKLGGNRLAAKARAAIAELAPSNWSAKRVDLAQRFARRANTTPIDPDWLTLQLAEVLPLDAVVVNEGLSSSRHLTDLIPYRDRYGFHALASGGIGWAVPAAVGIALAQAPRQVLCYSGDGSAMYTIQALWTAAHLKLPITYVIANNGGYRILKQRPQYFPGQDRVIGQGLSDSQDHFAPLGTAQGDA